MNRPLEPQSTHPDSDGIVLSELVESPLADRTSFHGMRGGSHVSPPVEVLVIEDEPVPPPTVAPPAAASSANLPSSPNAPPAKPSSTVWDLFEADGPVEAEYIPQSWPVWLVAKLYRFGETFFGIGSVLVCMAILATIPLFNFVTLGYLLECSAGIARTGKLSEGFVDIRQWARIGKYLLGTAMVLAPLWFASDLAKDAEVLTPGGAESRALRAALFVMTLLAVGHTLLAWGAGGKFRHFFWPLLAPMQLALWVVSSKVVGPIVRPAIEWMFPKLAADLYAPAPLDAWFPPAIAWRRLKQGPVAAYVETRDAVWDFFASLRIPKLFWLGLRGFVGSMIWLAIPCLLLMGSTKLKEGGGAFLFGMAGAFSLATVMMYLPFLQVHFAVQNRFAAMFELGQVRQMFRRAPIAFWFALLFTLALSLPLYLLKIEFPLREIAWATTLTFMLFIYPTKLLIGWAVGRARRRERPRFFLFRWMSRFAVVPVVLFYVLIVYLSQFTSWYGSWSVFEQHAVLLPSPFFSL